MVRVVARRQFGVSTDLYRAARLGREQLLEIASHGFEAVELVAADGHFDYRNPGAVADLQQWLAEAGLDLNTIAVSAAGTSRGQPGDKSGEPPGEDVEQALFVARWIPVKVLSVRVGKPKQAVRLLERLAELARPLGVTVAVDSRSESMTPMGSLVHFVSDGVDASVGIALDCAAAHKAGDLIDAIELASEHLAAVRVPAQSSIDWSQAMTTLQKVGYDGVLMFDGAGSAKETLARARQTRDTMERWLTST